MNKYPTNDNKKFDKQYFLEQLEDYSVLFRAVAELSQPIYTKQIDTAGVVLQNGKLYFLINYDFFWKLSEVERLFILCHESLHVFFNHFEYINNLSSGEYKLKELANIAMDIVINETLVNHFGFNRRKLNFYSNGQKTKIPFINTVFTKEQIEKYDIDFQKGYLYLLDCLKKEQYHYDESQYSGNKNNNKFSIKDTLGLGDIDNHDVNELNDDELNNQTDSNAANDDVVNSDNTNIDKNEQDNEHDENSNKQINNSDNKDEKNIEQNIENDDLSDNSSKNDNISDKDSINNNIDDENIEYDSYSSVKDDVKNNDENDTEQKHHFNSFSDVINEVKNLAEIKTEEILEYIENGGNFSSDNLGESHDELTFLKVKTNSRWKKIISFVNKSILDTKEVDEYSFARKNMVIDGIFSKQGMFLPALMKQETLIKNKTDLYFFFDVSGSCANYLPIFLNIVLKIPTNLFNVHLFAFANSVEKLEINNSGKLTNKINVGYGTCFRILQEQIDKDLNNKTIKQYPDFVCVLTDGFGEQVRNIPANKQKNWLWLLIDPNLSFSYDKKTKISDITIPRTTMSAHLDMLKRMDIIPFYDYKFNIDNPKIESKIKQGCKIYPASYLF